MKMLLRNHGHGEARRRHQGSTTPLHMYTVLSKSIVLCLKISISFACEI